MSSTNVVLIEAIIAWMSALLILQMNLKRIMAERGLTQMDVARKGGVSQSSVSNACRAARGQQLDIIEGIAKGLGISVSDLLSATPKGSEHDVVKLVELYTPLSTEGRNQVMHVAESEARYQETASKEK